MKIKHQRSKTKGFTLVELLVVIAIIAGLAAMSYGPIMKNIKAAAKTQAVGKAKNILSALGSFANEKDGLYPNDDTSTQSGGGGGSSNSYLQQLMDRGKVDNEKDFWVKENAAIGTVKTSEPNNDDTLDPGENAWGYVVGLTNTSNGNTPILFDACESAGQFNTKVWEGTAIVAKIDQSVRSLDIAYGDGKPLNEDGSGKTGPIEEKSGSSNVDLFAQEIIGDDAQVTVPAK